MMTSQPFYAVRIAVRNNETGETFTRDYVRGELRYGQDRFGAWALGDFLTLLFGWKAPLDQLSYWIQEIDFQTVVWNHQYKHTTHGER